MKQSRREVLEMIANGELDADQGAELLRTLDRERPGLDAWLLDPLVYAREHHAAVTAGVVLVVSLALAHAGIRFDGALDLHLVFEPVAMPTAVLDVFASWLLVAAALALAARLQHSRGRLIDFVFAVAFARVPVLIAGAILLAFADALRPPIDPTSPRLLALLVLVLAPCMIWTVALLYRGYRTASGLRGRKLWLSFMVTLVLAEFVSKLIV